MIQEAQDKIRAEQVDYFRKIEAANALNPTGFTSTITSAPRKKPRHDAPKGHEAFLKALEASGAEVMFEKLSGERIFGTIKTSDKFTISVIVGGDTRVLFKHDLSEFAVISHSGNSN